jgi:hypothetical protein
MLRVRVPCAQDSKVRYKKKLPNGESLGVDVGYPTGEAGMGAE